MLVIKRKTGETVVIGGEIFLTVLAVTDTGIVLDVEAPAETRIEWRRGWRKTVVPATGEPLQFALVLDLDHKIRLNNQTVVTLRKLGKDKASLGLVAPRHIPLQRGEVFKPA